MYLELKFIITVITRQAGRRGVRVNGGCMTSIFGPFPLKIGLVWFRSRNKKKPKKKI